ncbi:MAG: hypothetical protein ABS52_18940 [Gemmatimonadetes bacterium SCN 70-22]|nr:MAG: hypothetical protein ABS52_18940 [Gemmatimonadetes bacterium SCN 70-22]
MEVRMPIAQRHIRIGLLAVGTITLMAACTGATMMSGLNPAGSVSLQSLAPANGVTGVSVTMPMTMRFSGPLGTGMERYLALHETSISGQVVAGMWSWSADRRTVVFAPDAPLKSRTTYVIHMGGGMRDAAGSPLDYGACGGMGGRAVVGGMMGGSGTEMMGPGWKGLDGSYGMSFSFTTA